MSNGVLMRIPNGYKPKTLLNRHNEVLKQKGYVSFSTNERFDSTSLNDETDCVIFFFEDKDENNESIITYVKANIADFKKGDKDYIPSEWKEFTPLIYQGEGKRSWFLFDSMSIIKSDEVSKYVCENAPHINAVTRSNQIRFTKSYITTRIEQGLFM